VIVVGSSEIGLVTGIHVCDNGDRCVRKGQRHGWIGLAGCTEATMTNISSMAGMSIRVEGSPAVRQEEEASGGAKEGAGGRAWT
jgi:hypothetical protein